jgi:Mg/Co/Ni transporter MgtE
LSPRAACRLETLGFERVYDYVPGKVDWLARGLPTEGENAGEPRAGSFARDDVVTCDLEASVGDVREQILGSAYGFGLVVATGGTLLGRLRKSALEDADPSARAEDVMEPGPTTVRCDTSAAELRTRLEERDLRTAIVSTPEGLLVGVVRREALPADGGNG